VAGSAKFVSERAQVNRGVGILYEPPLSPVRGVRRPEHRSLSDHATPRTGCRQPKLRRIASLPRLSCAHAYTGPMQRNAEEHGRR